MKMRKNIVLAAFVLFFLLSGNIQAQKKYEWKEETAAGYTYRYVSNDPLGTRYYTLENGLTVITTVNKKEPRLQTIIATKAGSKTDPKNHTGLAHYLEHMLFKGTDKYGTADWGKEKQLLEEIDRLYEVYNSLTDKEERTRVYRQIDSVSGLAAKYAIANEYDNLMASIGAKGTNAFTWFEETAYINDVPSNRMAQWLKVEAERFRNPVFRIFHTELEAVYEEKNISLSSDDEKVIDSLLGAMFRKHNYGLQTTIGTVEHLKNPSLKEIRKYYETYYVPNNMCMILAGDFNPDEMIKQVDASFGYMKRKDVPVYTYEPEADLKKPVEISVTGKEAEYLTFGFRFPGASDAQTEVLEILAEILSNGKAGLLDGLVTRRELLSADAGAFILKDYSMLYFSGVPKGGQTLEQVKELMLAEVEKLKNGDFDEALVTAIVNNKKLSDMKQAESNAGRAYDLLDDFITNRDRASVLKGEEMKAKLSKKEIMAYAQKHLSKSPVIVYKRQSDEDTFVPVEKPQITPVEVNRDKQSPFVKEVLSMKVTELPAEFPDFSKSISRGMNGNKEILHVQNTTNDLFYLYFRIPVGFKYNNKLRILEQYFGFAGTIRQNAEAYDKELYKLAASVSISVGEEETYLSLSGLHQNFSASYSLFMSKLQGLQADETILASVKEIIRKEREDAKTNPDMVRRMLAGQGYYDGKNPSNDVLGYEDLAQLSVKELKALMDFMLSLDYRSLYYGPAGMDEFSSLTGSGSAMLTTPPPPAPGIKFEEYALKNVSENEMYLLNFPGAKSDVFWLFNGAPYSKELVPVISLYNEYFGGGMSSVVFQDIRESKALAYSTYSTYSLPVNSTKPFRFTAYIGCQTDKINDAVQAMNELLNKMPKSDSKFGVAKESLKNSIRTSRISGSGILFEFLRAEKLGLSMPVNKYVYDKLDQLTWADVEKFQKEYVAKHPRVIIIMGDFSKLENKDFAKEGVKLISLSLDQIFGY